MKKNLLLGLASLMLLSSCGINSFGKEITSIDDFVTISKDSDSNFNVVKSNRVFVKSDKGSDTSLSSVNHNAEIYSNNDFICEESTRYTGFTIKYNVDTYFLLAGDKNGVVSEDSTILDTYRQQAYDFISNDYQTVLEEYDRMKAFVGKGKAADIDGVSYTDISLTKADANTTLGYTLKYAFAKDGGVRNEEHYITLDKTDDKWGIVFYSQRITDVINGEEIYYVTEYQFSCLNDESLASKTLNAKNNLTSYTFTASGLGSDDVDLDGDIVLTKK